MLARLAASTYSVNTITTYKLDEYLRQFMPEEQAFQQQLSVDSEPFLLVPVEQMYPYFTRGVPPVRATGHSCLFLTSGTARMRIGNDAYSIRAGEVLLVRAGQVHSFEPGDVNTGFLCRFTDGFLANALGPGQGRAAFEFLHFWGSPLIQLDVQTAGFVENNLRRLLAEYGAHGLHYPELLRAYLLALLHELGRAYAAAPPLPLTAAGRITTRFKQLVAESLPSARRISDYAALLHLTPNHLTKCVRAVTGKSPAKWLEESRILEAKVLLFQSSLTVGEIALQVGIADASYFSRLFKQHVGVTPLAFRSRLAAS